MLIKCFLEYEHPEYRTAKNMKRGQILKQLMKAEGKSMVKEHYGIVISELLTVQINPDIPGIKLDWQKC